METFFNVNGPFDIAREGAQFTSSQSDFWKAVNAYEQGLSGAIGCYLFCIEHGSKITPWYVGKTVNKNGFQGEVFTPHKITVYNEVVSGTDRKPMKRKGQAVLFLFPLWTKGEKFSKASSSKAETILWLERTLMGMAYAQNPALSNIRDMTRLKTIQVPGLLGKKRRGRRYSAEIEVRRALVGRTV